MRELFDRVCTRPQMYAPTAEAAHGLIVGLAWVLVAQNGDKPLRDSIHRTTEALGDVMGVDTTRAVTLPMLCESKVEEGVRPFDVLRSNLKQFRRHLGFDQL